MSRRRSNIRLLIFVVGLVLAFSLLLSRAYYLQITTASEYRTRATEQAVDTYDVTGRRGVIYDRDGGELAVSIRTATIWADPQRVEDPEGAALALAPVLGMDPEVVEQRLNSDKQFVYLGRKLDPSVWERVRDLEIRGLGMRPEEKRIYPRGTLASHVLGYVGTDNVGLSGIESQYDDALSGAEGKRGVLRDASSRSLALLFDQEARHGDSLILTLDKDIQFESEQILKRLVEEFSAQRAAALVLDPETGEILAMANAPGFDANEFGDTPPEIRRNRTVTDQFEPGSTFKMVTVAAALEAGLVTPETSYTLPSEITVYDRTIHEAHHDVPDERQMSVTQILAESSNVGAVTLGMEVGKERLIRTIRRFGFTEPLDLGFPGEVGGMMPPEDEWSGTTITNIPMGQGISVTAIQMASAYGAIANDGVLIQPHLVIDGNAHPERRVVSERTAGDIRGMLKAAVSQGTGKQARIKGYTVGGKTGTAQKVEEDGSGYSNERFIASFVGMVPIEDPQLVVLVVVDEPTPHYGSIVAAPAFSKIADFALKHLEIAPHSSS